MTFPARPPRPRERSEQAGITHLLRSLGAKVYTLGTTRRRDDSHFGTMQTPGIGDLYCLLPAPKFCDGAPCGLWIEVKAPGGRLRPAQQEFRDACQAAGVPHVVGQLDTVIAWLVERGFIKADNVPHYRRPQP